MTSPAALACLACLALPLLACTDDPDAPAIELTEISCGRLGCDGGEPIAVGGRISVQPAELGIVTSIVSGTSLLATVERAPAGSDPEAEDWIVLARRPGVVHLELRDADGDVVGGHDLEIVEIDHLEATLKLFTPTRAIDVTNVLANQPHDVPSAATVRIQVDPHSPTGPLRGELAYELDFSLPAGGRVVESDPSGRALIGLARGENTVTFRSGLRADRFVFAAR